MFERFDIYFSGELIEGADPAEVRRSLCRMNGIDETKAIKLLSGMPVKVKSNVDVETAGKYRASFRKIGVLIDIRPCELTGSGPVGHSAPDSEPTTISGQETADSPTTIDEVTPPVNGIAVEEEAPLELLPANTGSLEDCARPKPVQPLPDVSDLAIDASGKPLDSSPEPPPALIDTSHLSAEPARVGSLEDCVVPKTIRPIPDVSHLRLLD
jgi:hypothetical protein